MAAPVVPLQTVKLAAGPSPITAEQRYWNSFKNPLLIPSPTNYPITHISSPRGVEQFAVTTGTRVQIFDSRTRKLQKTITRFGDIARSGEIRRDGRVLVAGDDGGVMQVFDMGSRAILRTWKTHKQPVWATRWSPSDLTGLLSASDDMTVRLWDLTEGEPTSTFAGHHDYVRAAEYMPGQMANMVVSGSYDATVKLWDPRVGRREAVMTFKHAKPVEAVLPLPSGTTVLAAAGEGVSVLDLVAAKPQKMITNHQKTVTSLSLASDGRRLVTGGLEGHVKVFETTGWNVVTTKKYQSPVLSVHVVPTATGDSTTDKHLAVGMQSGVLSLTTRQSSNEAARAKERQKEMDALVAGTYDQLDAAKAKKRRRAEASTKMDLIGEGADIVIANDRERKRREQPWQSDLRHARYAKALDEALDRTAPGFSHLNVLTLLIALRHRNAVRQALEDRDEESVQPVLRWVTAHIIDPRYVNVCVEVGLHLLDLYSEFVGGSEDLEDGFRKLGRKVRSETQRAQAATMTEGMLQSLMVGTE